MRKLTTTLYLTIAVFFGSAGVSLRLIESSNKSGKPKATEYATIEI
jgi:hypothetical protein